MKTRLKLNPDKKGPKPWLIFMATRCLRPLPLRRSKPYTNKSVEIIVEKTGWTPPQPKFSDDTLVPVQTAFAENELMKSAKAAGGRWNPEKRDWFIAYGKVKGTELEKHIVVDADQPDALNSKSYQSI